VKTLKELYGGNGFQSKEISKKIKTSMLLNHGVEHPQQSKEIVSRIKKTNIERYGVEHPTQNKNVIKKIKTTNIRKYGVENTFQLPKTKQTFLEKYNVINPSQIPEIQEKLKQTCLKKYGCEHFFESDFFKNCSKQTCLKKYGVENVMQCEEIRNKAQKAQIKKSYRMLEYFTIFGDTINYQSMSELEFIKICELKGIRVLNGGSIPYILDGKLRMYFVDFKIFEPHGIRLIEVKRKHVWWFRDLKSGMIREKAKSAISFSKLNNFLPYKILFKNE
jgi:hypothetical protein